MTATDYTLASPFILFRSAGGGEKRRSLPVINLDKSKRVSLFLTDKIVHICVSDKPLERK